MLLITGKDIAILYFGMFGAAIVWLPLIFIMHFLMPKAVLDRYWKPPHFISPEIEYFSDPLHIPQRTVFLLAAIVFSRFSKKREMTDAHQLVPAWYKAAAWVICVWIIAVIVGLLVMHIGLSVHLHIIGEFPSS